MIAYGNIFRLPLENKLSDGLRSNVHPYSAQSADRIRLPCQSHLLVDFSPRSPSQMTDGSLPSRFIIIEIFKVCVFIRSLRQFSEPVFGTPCRSGSISHVGSTTRKKHRRNGGVRVVEPTGVEPVSENLLI